MTSPARPLPLVMASVTLLTALWAVFHKRPFDAARDVCFCLWFLSMWGGRDSVLTRAKWVVLAVLTVALLGLLLR